LSARLPEIQDAHLLGVTISWSK